jgi:hypothetical protein
VVLCALGCLAGITLKCLAVIGAVGWTEFVADLHLQFLERATSTHDRKFTSALPTMFRRITLVFTPFAWIAGGYHVLKAIRAPSITAAFRDTAIWMLLAALVFLYLFRQLAASQMLASQVLLPFYAIGSAVVVERLLDGRMLFRRLAWAWLIAAPLWSFYFMFTHPRSVLERDDVAKTNAYLAANDHNDFLMSNLMSDGHIQASFEHHSWAALDADDTTDSAVQMLRVFELTDTDYVHAIIFNEPNSRFIDKSLWPLAMPRGLWAVTGWPQLYRKKTNSVIAEYDRRVHKNLVAVRAQKVLELTNYAVYRIDRGTVMALLAEKVPATRRIDFGSLASQRNVILGWTPPDFYGKDGTPASTVDGFYRCSLPRSDPRGDTCKTVLTKFGIFVKHEEHVQRGQLMVKLDEACDTRFVFTFATSVYTGLSARGFTATAPPGRTATFFVPATHLTKGVNIIELENLVPRDYGTDLPVATLDLVPSCGT